MDVLFKVKAVNEIVTSAETGVMHMGVTIHWFCADRALPVVPYELAIPEWAEILESDRIDDRQLSYYNTASTYIDQYFSRDEAQTLCHYLTTHHAAEIVLESLELPLKEADVPFSAIPDEPAAGEGYGFIDLPDLTDFPLPFTVRGYFDTRYDNTLERYQIAVTRSLTNFEITDVGEESDSFQEMAAGLKKRLIELHDSILNLRNVFDMLHGRVQSYPDFNMSNDNLLHNEDN